MGALARRLGFAALLFYGVGDILGAGIYALVGKVIGQAGSGAWLTFVLSAIVAILTGLSYAELTARYPVAAGAAAFVRHAFPGKFVATITGVLVGGTGLVSASTVTTAFSGYLHTLVPIPEELAQFFLITGMSFLSFWGIRESSRVNIVLTIIEFSGLLFVIFVGVTLFKPDLIQNFWEQTQTEMDILHVLKGMTIAFFAYIGFEDLCNLAEECKNPTKDLPRAIIIAISIATIIYLSVTLVLQITVAPDLIAISKTPLLLVFQNAGMEWVLRYFSIIAILAISNTGLINLIMSSRLMYGMANESLLPPLFNRVHPKRQTPWVGVFVAYLLVLILVYTGSVKVLAQTSSFLILIVFFWVHLSLIRIKIKKESHTGIRFPIIFPILGGLLCLGLMFFFPKEAYLRGLILPAIAILIWLVQVRSTQK